MKRLCEQAGIKGYKTNHSLRVTAATRLFQSGMDEQLIMERTGHRSTDGVRAYKRSSLQQQALVSRVLKCLPRHTLQAVPLNYMAAVVQIYNMYKRGLTRYCEAIIAHGSWDWCTQSKLIYASLRI